jgi:hypothetical protein
MDGIVAVIGTLLGALLGAAGTLIAQRNQHAHEATERQRALQREACIDWLRVIHELFESVRSASRAHRRGDIDAEEYGRRVRNLSSVRAQDSLETLRIVSGDGVTAGAAELWAHLRRQPVPIGQDASTEGWVRWDNQYWALRRAFINAARREQGLPDLDWARVGVSPVRLDEKK